MERSIGDSTETGPRAQRHVRAGKCARLFGPAVGAGAPDPGPRDRRRQTAAPFGTAVGASDPGDKPRDHRPSESLVAPRPGQPVLWPGKALHARQAEPVAERAVDTGRVPDLTVSSAAMTMGAVHGNRPSTAHTPASSVPGGEKGGCFRAAAGGCFRYP